MALHQMTSGGGGGTLLAGAERKLAQAYGASSLDLDEGYKQLPEAMTSVEQLLEDAIRFDEQHSTTFWQELGEVVQHGFNYFADKRRFDAEVRTVVEGARASAKTLRGIVDGVIAKMGAPDHLKSEFARWEAVLGITDPTMDAIPTLARIEPWRGQNADNFETMAGVQSEAAAEYKPMPKNMKESVARAWRLNVAVLNLVHNAVEGCRIRSSRRWTAGDKEFYVNTVNVDNNLRQCIGNVARSLSIVGTQTESMRSAVDEVRTSPVIIRSGWPSGMSQSGQQGNPTQLGPMNSTMASPKVMSSHTVRGVHR